MKTVAAAFVLVIAVTVISAHPELLPGLIGGVLAYLLWAWWTAEA